MGGFNPINFIFNTANVNGINFADKQGTNQAQSNFSAAQSSANQAAANTNASVNKAAPSTSFTAINYTNSQSQSATSQMGLTSANQLIISTVEIEQRANYVKDLLNLPRGFEDFINQIQAGNNLNNAALDKFSKLLINGKINLPALASLLSDNSKEAIQKLMATISAVSKMGASDVSQLKELMGLFSAASISQDAAQTAKNLLLLYLPWLPLSFRSDLNLDFDIDIFDKIQGPDPNAIEAQETVKIMVETANFGNILIELTLTANNEVDVYICANENFPEAEVIKKFKEENKKTNIRANVSIEKSAKSPQSAYSGGNVQIISSNCVSPKLVQGAHSLIKIIIDIDSSNFIINEETEG